MLWASASRGFLPTPPQQFTFDDPVENDHTSRKSLSSPKSGLALGAIRSEWDEVAFFDAKHRLDFRSVGYYVINNQPIAVHNVLVIKALGICDDLLS